MKDAKWSENVILVDADYDDKVTFDLIVNFERMIGRRIPKTDMARWLECVALDGGIRLDKEQGARGKEQGARGKGQGARGKGQEDTSAADISPASTQVILLHKQQEMKNFVPGAFSELDGQAFKGALGEFLISCVVVEDMVTPDDLFVDSLQVISNAAEVRRLIVVPNAEHIYNKVREGLRHADPDKHTTVLTMQPMEGGQFRQEILGYSLMAALGIRSEELTEGQGARSMEQENSNFI